MNKSTNLSTDSVAQQAGHRCGYAAIVGQPNVGKSTLLNRLIGQKLSITSHKAQTTRHSIVGIRTAQNWQIIYVDTPGLHTGEKHAINRMMNRTACTTMEGVDVIVFVVNGLSWHDNDELVLKRLQASQLPVILAINKIDLIKDKTRLLPYLQELHAKMNFLAVIPISAKREDNLVALEQAIITALPAGPHLFSDDQITDRSSRFIAGELIREKLFRLTNQELPYAITVEVEQFAMRKGMYHITALIWAERKSQKGIIIGRQGERLKQIGSQARADLEKMLAKKVFLQLWVKVKAGWRDDDRLLSELGYG